MTGLKRLLEHTAGGKLMMGGTLSESVVKGLESYRQRLFITFIVLFVVLIALVVFGSYGLARSMGDAGSLKAFVAAMGISVGGLVEAMRRTWREWSQTQLLLVLIEEAPESQIRALIDKLIQKL
jgi:branched-subunit amino acid ABC-type transport system permease component